MKVNLLATGKLQIRKNDKLANSQVIRCLQLRIAYSINDVSNIYI